MIRQLPYAASRCTSDYSCDPNQHAYFQATDSQFILVRPSLNDSDSTSPASTVQLASIAKRVIWTCPESLFDLLSEERAHFRRSQFCAFLHKSPLCRHSDFTLVYLATSPPSYSQPRSECRPEAPRSILSKATSLLMEPATILSKQSPISPQLSMPQTT